MLCSNPLTTGEKGLYYLERWGNQSLNMVWGNKAEIATKTTTGTWSRHRFGSLEVLDGQFSILQQHSRALPSTSRHLQVWHLQAPLEHLQNTSRHPQGTSRHLWGTSRHLNLHLFISVIKYSAIALKVFDTFYISNRYIILPQLSGFHSSHCQSSRAHSVGISGMFTGVNRTPPRSAHDNG